jgi:hypothetical protein
MQVIKVELFLSYEILILVFQNELYIHTIILKVFKDASNNILAYCQNIYHGVDYSSGRFCYTVFLIGVLNI